MGEGSQVPTLIVVLIPAYCTAIWMPAPSIFVIAYFILKKNIFQKITFVNFFGTFYGRHGALCDGERFGCFLTFEALTLRGIGAAASSSFFGRVDCVASLKIVIQ